MTYKKYCIMEIFENLFYTPYFSDTNVKVFKFNI